MIQGKKKVTLTPKAILDKITEYDIFRFYMSGKWEVNNITYSPFRKENNPSFLISNRGGGLHFVDFADTSKRGDCFTFVKQLYNLSNIDEVLKMIDKDFGLGISTGIVGDYKKITQQYSQPEELGKRYSLIQVQVRKFTNEELAYWNQYHQDITDLQKENIFSIDKLYLNRQLFSLKPTELRFGYFYDGNWKIYRPYGTSKEKWVPNNVPITTMEGKQNINNCELAFINKSKKDYMVIKKLFPNTCAVQNEGIACFSEENINFLKSNSKKQVLSFDSDSTGVENSKLITSTFDFDYCNVPRSYLSDGIKDWADLAKEYGMSTVEKILIKKGII